MAVNLDHLANHIERLHWVADRERELKQLKTELRAQVEEALDTEEVGTVNGEPAVKWTNRTSSRLNQKLLAEKYPDILAECKTESVSRVFEIL